MTKGKKMNQEELDRMPPPPARPTQDGVPFALARIAVSGGQDITLTTQADVDALDAFPLEADVTLMVDGRVASKNWRVAWNQDGDPVRTLVIGIRVDRVDELDGRAPDA